MVCWFSSIQSIVQVGEMKRSISDNLLDQVGVLESDAGARLPDLPDSGDEAVKSDFNQGMLNSTMIPQPADEKVGQIVRCVNI